MSSLTRWVLAHKRTVVLTWIALTIAGIMAAGPASDALKAEFSIPNKESWKTNVAIAERYHGDRNGSAPLMPVVTVPKGETVRSPAVRADLKRLAPPSARTPRLKRPPVRPSAGSRSAAARCT